MGASIAKHNGKFVKLGENTVILFLKQKTQINFFRNSKFYWSFAYLYVLVYLEIGGCMKWKGNQGQRNTQ